MFNKWELMNRATQVRDIDEVMPAIHTLVTIPDCQKWHQIVQQQIGEKVALVQNTGLEQFKLKNLNDQINALILQKRQIEKQLRKIGGPDLHADIETSNNIFNINGYYYFGAAKYLPGVYEEHQRLSKKTPQPDYEGL